MPTSSNHTKPTIVYVAEKNMRALFGHYADVVARMGIAAQDLGVELKVGCSNELQSECQSYFEALGIPLVPELKSSNLTRSERMLARTIGVGRYKSLRKRIYPGKGGATFQSSHHLPTVFPSAEISDVFVWACNPELPKAIFAFWGSPELEFNGANQALSKLFERVAPHNIILGAYDSFTLNELLPLKKFVSVQRLPCPYDLEASDTQTARSDDLTIGFFGWMRNERGAHLKESLKQACKDAGFKVLDQSMSNSASKAGSEEQSKYLANLGKAMHGCDVILWPASASAYRTRTSGIVFNALANGIPIVMPNNCRPYDIVREYYHPHSVFKEHSVDSILSAIHRLKDDIVEYRKAAKSSLELFASREGTRAFIKQCSRLLVD